MRAVPERSAATRIATVFGAFLLGPLGAERASAYLAPGAEFTQTVAAFAFATIFVAGTLIWMGLGVGAVVLRALASLVRGRPPRPVRSAGQERVVPPGYRIYVVLGVLLGLGVGLLAGLATDLGIVAALGAWGGLGLGYGAVLYAAAHHGYLPCPEPE